MGLVKVLPSEEDEVNVACFHPSVGGGLVYGTKKGKLRILHYDSSHGMNYTSSSFPNENMLEVLARGVECDIALLSVESEEFWKGAEPLQSGRLPRLQDAVTVVGYPLGGDTISVTKGVVSRIEVQMLSSIL